MAGSVTLFCLPCAGASATVYLRWRRLVPGWITIEPVELPGRGSRMREPFQEDCRTLTADLCDRVMSVSSGQYALFGHSMGALLAYGIVRGLLARKVVPPLALLVAGCEAPVCQDSERYAGMQDHDALMSDLRELGGTPEAVFDEPELLAMTLDLLRADYRICGSFRYERLLRLPVPVHAFGGRADSIDASELYAWQRETSRSFTLDWFEGGHFFLRQSEERFLSVLIERLAQSRMESE